MEQINPSFINSFRSSVLFDDKLASFRDESDDNKEGLKQIQNSWQNSVVNLFGSKNEPLVKKKEKVPEIVDQNKKSIKSMRFN